MTFSALFSKCSSGTKLRSLLDISVAVLRDEMLTPTLTPHPSTILTIPIVQLFPFVPLTPCALLRYQRIFSFSSHSFSNQHRSSLSPSTTYFISLVMCMCVFASIVHRQRGSPGLGIYVAYCKAAGGIVLFLVSAMYRYANIFSLMSRHQVARK